MRLAALRSKAARAQGVGKQHNETVSDKEACPFDIVPRVADGAVMGEAATIMQRDDGRKRARTLGTIERSVQLKLSVRDVDMLRHGGHGIAAQGSCSNSGA